MKVFEALRVAHIDKQPLFRANLDVVFDMSSAARLGIVGCVDLIPQFGSKTASVAGAVFGCTNAVRAVQILVRRDCLGAR